MNRVCQIVLICSTLVASSLGMEAVHESGHVIGALATDGKVTRVVLSPVRISRTDVTGSSNPLVVVWAGPVVGVVLPAVIWLSAKWIRVTGVFVLRFFAGFCLVANGLYIGVGSVDRVGDCGEMIRQGSPTWLLWMFGAITTPIGFALWHGQGKYFGFGESEGKVSLAITIATICLCLSLIALGLAIDGQ